MTNEDIRSKHMLLLQMMIVQVSCIIAVICALKTKSRRSRIPSRITTHRERVRGELMKQIVGNEVVEEVHPDISPKRPCTGHSQDASSSRTKKHARKVVEDDINMGDIANVFQKMAEVFDWSTKELIKQNKNASAKDIWAKLEDIGVEPASFNHVYMHLVQHPDAWKAFNGAPVHKRKEILSHIVPGYSPHY